jgi:membrane protein required for colicin V production
MMLIADILLIALLIFFIYKGVKDGFIDTLCSLLGISIGLYGAHILYAGTSRWLMKLTGWGMTFTQVLMFIVLFVIINRLVSWLLYLGEKILNTIARFPIIKQLNKLLGGLGGFIIGIIILGGGLYLLERFFHYAPLIILIHSTVAEYIKLLFNYLLPGMAKVFLSL